MSRRRLTRAGMALVGAGLALALLAGEARAGKYAVAQCGWRVGADADWADTTGGAKFRPDAYCVPPAGSDPFDGVHMKSFTRAGSETVSGTRFARWRWAAPAGTGITRVQGTWWHALHDGLEHRVGVGTTAGGFEPFLRATATDVAPRGFVAGFSAPMPALEDRLLCARAASKWCSLEAGSWSGLRALTITLEDNFVPGAAIGGRLLAAGWRRGVEVIAMASADRGAGVRFGETLIDGARVGLTEYPCRAALIGGEWRATAMRPCPNEVAGAQPVATTALSDGPHTLRHCVTDFAANVGCAPPRQVLVDNNPPAAPRAPRLSGGDGWRRTREFELRWANPGQGPASPIVGAAWRLTGPAGFDTGRRYAAGRDRASLDGVAVPAPGTYSLALWLRDEAGNEDPGAAATVALRFDDVAPGVAFALAAGEGVPERLVATVADAHSGPAGGTISYRRLGAEGWTELPTRIAAGGKPGSVQLSAPMPELAPGIYRFRAEARDAAGNATTTTRRADGTEMAVRRLAPVVVPRARTRLFARLWGGRGRGDALTVGFGARARLGGRLVRADGAGVAGRRLRIVARPSKGAPGETTRTTVRTGRRGGFRLRLPPGPSRRIAVIFPGDGGLEPARRAPLELRVRSGLTLTARPRGLRTGEAVRLRGRVRTRGAALPRRGKLVAIQYLEAATRRWRPVLVTRTDRRGRFRARYRFRYVTGRARIRLRATALAEEQWPYAPGSSKPATIQVRG